MGETVERIGGTHHCRRTVVDHGATVASPYRGRVPGASAPARRVTDLAAIAGVDINPSELDAIPVEPDAAELRCPVLQNAAAGVSWLTGAPDAPPSVVTVPVVASVEAVCRGIAWLGARVGVALAPSPHAMLTARAAVRGFRRAGAVSANGSCRLLRSRDHWVACNLARPTDVDLLAAVTGEQGPDPWAILQRAAGSSAAADLVERVQLVGVPAAVVGDAGAEGPLSVWAADGTAPGSARSTAPGSARGTSGLSGRVVVDFSAMWAGPLCAHLLGAAGATVVKVEDPARPDAARQGDPALFEEMHRGHQLLRASFGSAEGVRTIAAALEGADVVIESSRPRALAQLGVTPAQFLRSRRGRTWVSITGYGRSGRRANWVAFGDDAAVAGGITGEAPDGSPVFCADAVADPVTGAMAAFGALSSIVAGGGHMVSVPMAGAARWVAAGPTCPAVHTVDGSAADGWVVRHRGVRDVAQAVLAPRAAAVLR